METRANYVLIGAFTLAGIVLGLAFFVWLAKFQIDRQYAYYDVLFEDVSGLSRAADVRFSGLSVGQVVSLELNNQGAGRVRVRIEVASDTPIHEGATAQLQSQGVTGVSLVSVSGGDSDKPLLRETAAGGVPVIPGERSVVQSLTEDAPDLLTESIKLVRDFQGIVGSENQAKVAGILANVEAASGEFETALSDFSSISRSVASATGQISDFTDKLQPIADSVESALGEAEKTMVAMTGAFNQAGTTLGTADTTLKSVDGVANAAGDLIRDDGSAAIASFKETLLTLQGLVDALGTEAKTVLAAFGDTATLASARLTDLETTIAGLDSAIDGATTTLASVDSAATSFDSLVEGDGTLLVSEARATLASAEAPLAAIEQAATTDLPAIIADVRRALLTVNDTVDKVSADITTFTGDLAPVAEMATTTLDAATATFRDASAALDALEPAIASAERTLAAAETAFTGAERVISEDVAPATADLRASVARMSTAVDQVSADLPAVTAELRTTLAAATATVTRIDGLVQQSAAPVGQFATQGLPQFVRFTAEAQALVARMDRIAAQLERDPARFFLGAPAPNFRR
jgi:phospholipid/cholesterol/gamma-HCH transport system substrate-binding protein